MERVRGPAAVGAASSPNPNPLEPMDPELLDILVCPESKQTVSPAPPALMERVNAAIAAGGLRNRGGDAVTDPLTEALVREDGALLYAIREGIPVMLIDESIDLTQI